MERFSDVEITLVENSTAGNPPRHFSGQTVEADHEADTVVQGVDGHISTGRYPWKIVWRGRQASDLAHITNVKIVRANGHLLVDGELNTTYGAPRDVTRGVEFWVLEPG
jgi:hypothetical protein